MVFSLSAEVSNPKSKSVAGKRSTRPPLSEKEALHQAEMLLANNQLSPQALQVVEALMCAGVLTTHQLQQATGISPASLKRYHQRHLINHQVAPAPLRQAGLPLTKTVSKRLRLYTLGAVGQAIATLRQVDTSAYLGYGAAQLTHDIFCNETILHLLQQAVTAGFTTQWLGKGEARVFSPTGECVLEPDSLLILAKNAHTLGFAVEYHNENHAGRCLDKVERYERAHRDQFWREAWPLPDFPVVLAVFSYKLIARGYTEAIHRVRGRGQLVRFMGKKFTLHDAAPTTFYDFQLRQNLNILSLTDAPPASPRSPPG